jgi:hypothetical protein
MKERHLVSVILFAGLLCIPVSGFANRKSNAATRLRQSCVRCAFNGGGCRTCMGGGNAVYCETFNCGLCSEDGECDGGIGGSMLSKNQSVQSTTPTTSKDSEPLRISSRVIREIATMHPRFAITLAEMNIYGIFPGERRLYWTPIKLSTSDVEKFLSKEAYSKYFRRYDQEVRKLNRLIQKGELTDIVYRVSTKQTEEGSWTIMMHVEGELAATSWVDPAYSTLEIHVSGAQSVQGAMGERSQRKVTWQIQ